MKAIFNTEKELREFQKKLCSTFPTPREVITGRFSTEPSPGLIAAPKESDKFYIKWSNVDTNIEHYKISSDLGYDENQCYKKYVKERGYL